MDAVDDEDDWCGDRIVRKHNVSDGQAQRKRCDDDVSDGAGWPHTTQSHDIHEARLQWQQLTDGHRVT